MCLKTVWKLLSTKGKFTVELGGCWWNYITHSIVICFFINQILCKYHFAYAKGIFKLTMFEYSPGQWLSTILDPMPPFGNISFVMPNLVFLNEIHR